MADQRASLDIIEDFLAQKRIAIAGISRNSATDSARLFEEFIRRGYDVVPVNPNTAQVRGRRCFALFCHATDCLTLLPMAGILLANRSG